MLEIKIYFRKSNAPYIISFSVVYIVKRIVIAYQYYHCLLLLWHLFHYYYYYSTVVTSILLPDPRTAIFSSLK